MLLSIKHKFSLQKSGERLMTQMKFVVILILKNKEILE